jgi:hypothetical protein
MKHINKVLKTNGIKQFFIFDKGTAKGFPNKDSLGLNILYSITEKGYITYAYSIKVPGDDYIQRIGNSITYRKFKSEKFTLPIPKKCKALSLGETDSCLYTILEDLYTFEVFKKCYDKRIINLISKYITDLTVFNFDKSGEY